MDTPNREHAMLAEFGSQSPTTSKFASTPTSGATTPTSFGRLDESTNLPVLSTRISHARRGRRAIGLPISQKIKNVFQNRDNIRFAACLWSCGCAGWSDAALGALIPYMELYYNIGYTTVSTLFIGSCVGFGIATFLNTYLTDKFGNGKVLTLGAAIQIIGYAIILAPPPFPVLPCAFVLTGLGVALQLAQTNTYVALMPNSAQALGYLHGGYGLGGAFSPLVATLFVSSGIKFSYFFAVSLSVAAINLLVLLLAFRLESNSEPSTSAAVGSNDQELDRLAQGSSRPSRLQTSEASTDAEEHPTSSPVQTTPSEPMESTLSQAENEHRGKAILKERVTWIVSGFLLLYCGAEVSIGGWIVSFLIEERAGPASVGYVATGFWSGITLGRIVLPRLNLLVGEKRVVFIYLALTLALELVIWFAKELIAASVSVALVGFLLGPLYPNAISIASKLLPRRLHTGSIGIFASIGSAGSALFPFLTGILASRHGTWVLQPMVISLLGGMAVMWIFLPSVQRRRD